jgi:hypothetical protein
MDFAPIRTKRDYRRVLKEIEGLIMGAKRGTPEGDRLEVLVALVEAWEAKHCSIDLSDYHIIPGKHQTELEKFASWFHQDWKLIYPHFYEGAKIYINDLSAERKGVLRQELLNFISTNADRRSEAVISSWCDLGADAWQSDLEILATLKDFADLL